MKILVTGGFGFIGSNLVKYLNEKGIKPYVSDNSIENWKNVASLDFYFELVLQNYYDIIVHLGANVDTTEEMNFRLWANNVDYPINELINRCGKFIYASSAATYGAEELDFRERLFNLAPLNAYAFTKLQLDRLLENRYNCVGLRFFNVYGPNEGHKGKMASVVHQVLSKKTPIYIKDGEYNLFKSYRDGINHGEQKRDFIHVSDICRVIYFFIKKQSPSGIFNVGTGKARSFNDLIKAIDPEALIHYVEMPEGLKKQYQYYTCANIKKLREAGYTQEFIDIEEGVKLCGF